VVVPDDGGHLGQLVHEGEDGVELALEMDHFFLGDGDAREMRHPPDRRYNLEFSISRYP